MNQPVNTVCTGKAIAAIMKAYPTSYDSPARPSVAPPPRKVAAKVEKTTGQIRRRPATEKSSAFLMRRAV
jgi:hypothetical protein